MTTTFDLSAFYEVNAVECLVSYQDMPETYGRAFDVFWRVYAPEADDVTSLVIHAEGQLGPYIDQDLKIAYSQLFDGWGTITDALLAASNSKGTTTQ